MNAEALARVLCAVDGIDPDSESTPEPHDPADYAWEAYVEDARRILADPAPLLAALAESGVLTEEWTVRHSQGTHPGSFTEEAAREWIAADVKRDRVRRLQARGRQALLRRYTTDWTEVSP